jgi:hypothetical protein
MLAKGSSRWFVKLAFLNPVLLSRAPSNLTHRTRNQCWASLALLAASIGIETFIIVRMAILQT